MRNSTSLDMTQVIPTVVEMIVGKVHTAQPCRVESYDRSHQTVDVTPLINWVDGRGNSVQYRKLSGVPVLFPSSDGGGVTLPVSRGDYGLLVFAERATDEVLDSGKPETPQDMRRYHLSDGFFIPGLIAGSAAPKAQYDDAVEISCGQVRIVLRNGKVAIGVGAVELLKLISDTLQGLVNATTTVAGVQVPLTNAATFAALKVQLELIRGDL